MCCACQAILPVSRPSKGLDPAGLNLQAEFPGKTTLISLAPLASFSHGEAKKCFRLATAYDLARSPDRAAPGKLKPCAALLASFSQGEAPKVLRFASLASGTQAAPREAKRCAALAMLPVPRPSKGLDRRSQSEELKDLISLAPLAQLPPKQMCCARFFLPVFRSSKCLDRRSQSARESIQEKDPHQSRSARQS